MKWLGIDIAKRKFDLAVLDNGKIRSKVFENTPTGHETLLAWLAARGHQLEELHACMEATSQYYEKLAIFLHDAGIRVSVINPLQIKGPWRIPTEPAKDGSSRCGVDCPFCRTTIATVVAPGAARNT
jgi:transposase